jgi:hypothetical protein
LKWVDEHPAVPSFLFLQYNDPSPDQPLPQQILSGLSRGYGRLLARLFSSKTVMTRRLVAGLLSQNRATLKPAELDAIRSIYRVSVSYTDRALGALFLGLKKRGLFDSSTIVVTGDRGEPLMSVGLSLHDSLCQDCVSIPLVMKLGSIAKFVGRSIYFAQNVDVAPTLVELFGFVQKSEPQGVSLLCAARNEKPLRTMAYHASEFGGRALRRGSHKLIVEGKKMRLFDLAIDPEERHDLLANPLHMKLFAKPWATSKTEAWKMMQDVRLQVYKVKEMLQREFAQFKRSLTAKAGQQPATLAKTK